MATQTPFSFLESFFEKFPVPDLKPPAWAVLEAQRRVVLVLNHVLMQESEATLRLARQTGRIVAVQWRNFSFNLVATPAGLLDLAEQQVQADLVLTMTDESPLALAQAALRGDKPAVRIEGDVQLAAEVNWLTEHVRWDMEEDLSRIMGDVPAHTLSQLAQGLSGALRQFVTTLAAFVPGKGPQ
jgi:ubiquinone biosynthesis protein UbiJ